MSLFMLESISSSQKKLLFQTALLDFYAWWLMWPSTIIIRKYLEVITINDNDKNGGCLSIKRLPFCEISQNNHQLFIFM